MDSIAVLSAFLVGRWCRIRCVSVSISLSGISLVSALYAAPARARSYTQILFSFYSRLLQFPLRNYNTSYRYEEDNIVNNTARSLPVSSVPYG